MARRKDHIALINRVKKKLGVNASELANIIGGTNRGQLTTAPKAYQKGGYKTTIADSLVDSLKKLDQGQRPERVFRIPKRIKKIRAEARKKSRRRLPKYQWFIARVICDTDSFKKYSHSFNFVADGRNKKTRASLQTRAKRLHKEIFADHRPITPFEVS